MGTNSALGEFGCWQRMGTYSHLWLPSPSSNGVVVVFHVRAVGACRRTKLCWAVFVLWTRRTRLSVGMSALIRRMSVKSIITCFQWFVFTFSSSCSILHFICHRSPYIVYKPLQAFLQMILPLTKTALHYFVLTIVVLPLSFLAKAPQKTRGSSLLLNFQLLWMCCP